MYGKATIIAAVIIVLVSFPALNCFCGSCEMAPRSNTADMPQRVTQPVHLMSAMSEHEGCCPASGVRLTAVTCGESPLLLPAVESKTNSMIVAAQVDSLIRDFVIPAQVTQPYAISTDAPIHAPPLSLRV